jgi:hypothetical protein
MNNERPGIAFEDLERAVDLAVTEARRKGVDDRGCAVLAALLRERRVRRAVRLAGIPEGSFRRERTKILRALDASRLDELRIRYLLQAQAERLTATSRD